jgi:hypothetical protein
MRRTAFVLLGLVLLAGTAWTADGWSRYHNVWYGYGVDIPAGFSEVEESGNGDDGFSHSSDGQSTLQVWGSLASLGPFETDVRERIESDTKDGWQITYQQVDSGWASWSGERNGRILYARLIGLCGDEARGGFRLEYLAAQRERFDPIVKRLVDSFKHKICE